MKYSPVTGKSNYTASPSIDFFSLFVYNSDEKSIQDPRLNFLWTHRKSPSKYLMFRTIAPYHVSHLSRKRDGRWIVKRIQKDGRKRVRSNSRIRRTLNRRSGNCASCPAPSSPIQAATTLKLLHVRRGAVNSRELSRPKLFHVRKLESSASG